LSSVVGFGFAFLRRAKNSWRFFWFIDKVSVELV